MPGKVSVTEEVSPEIGLTKEEIEKGIWNSPPTEKGQGRYLIHGKTIAPADFGKIREYVRYWDQEFLEEADMFFASVGWRINAAGLTALRELGYDVEIDTLESQKQRREEIAAKEKAAKEQAESERKVTGEKFKADVAEYEKYLGNPEWAGTAPENHGDQILLKVFRASEYQYTEYYCLKSGHIHVFIQHMYDMWDNMYSVSQAPARVQEEARRLMAEKRAEQERGQSECEERRSHQIFFRMVCPTCGRTVYIRDDMVRDSKDGKVGCGKCSKPKKVVYFGKNETVERKDIPENSEIKG